MEQKEWNQKQAMGIFFAKTCMSRRELAIELNVAECTVTDWYREHEYFDIPTAEKIARIGGITLQELIQWGIDS